MTLQNIIEILRRINERDAVKKSREEFPNLSSKQVIENDNKYAQVAPTLSLKGDSQDYTGCQNDQSYMLQH